MKKNLKTRTISNHNHQLAIEYFKGNGEGFDGCILHHINPNGKENDIQRYIQWNPRDLQVVSRAEHMKIHNRYLDRTKMVTPESNKKRSDTMKQYCKEYGSGSKGKTGDMSDEAKANHSKSMIGKNANRHRVYNSDGTWHMENN